jgi:hypothetical protein
VSDRDEPSAPTAGPDSPGGEEPGGGWGAAKALEVLALAFVFPVAVGIGFWLGGRVGEWLGAPVAGAVVGGVCGAAAGFYELFVLVRRLR